MVLKTQTNEPFSVSKSATVAGELMRGTSTLPSPRKVSAFECSRQVSRAEFPDFQKKFGNFLDRIVFLETVPSK